MDSGTLSNIIENPNITGEGLSYLDEETGEVKQMERCDEQDKGSYKYDVKTYQYKQYLLKECANMYPNIDKCMVEHLVDWYLNHTDEVEELMKKDKKYLKCIKEE
jgi:RNA processing factor Prp31